MPRMEIPENWDEMTNEEKDAFYYENARAPSGWSKMKWEDCLDYFRHNCDCADNIYEDIREYLMSIPRFKQAYTILKSPYNLRSKKLSNNIDVKKTAIHTIISIIIDEIESYSKHGVDQFRCLALVGSCREFYEKGHLNSVRKKHWFSTDTKLSTIEGKEEAFDYYEKVYYEPTLRWYYDLPCKCSFMQYNEWESYDGEIEESAECISCETFANLETLIRGGFIVNMFNIFTEPEIKEQLLTFIKLVEKYGIALKNKIIEFGKVDDQIFTSYWKGADYYYKKLFYSSIHIDSLNIPFDILKQRYEWNFDAMICGHPKASHGWFAEGLKEFEKYIDSIKS